MASTASCVCTPPHLMVQQELWGACVHGRGTQDSPRAPPGQETLQPQWEAWAGRLTTTGPGQLAPLCALGFLSSKDSTTQRASEARAALQEGLCSPQVCSGPVMPGQSLMAGCTLGSPGACLLFLLALGSRVG